MTTKKDLLFEIKVLQKEVDYLMSEKIEAHDEAMRMYNSRKGELDKMYHESWQEKYRIANLENIQLKRENEKLKAQIDSDPQKKIRELETALDEIQEYM